MIDIGGTSIKSALYEPQSSKYFAHHQVSLDPSNIQLAISEQILLYQIYFSDISKVLIAATGVINDKGAVVAENGLISNYLKLNIKDIVESNFSFPCQVINDVNALALNYLDYDNAFVMTIGTGIGGVLICQQHLVCGTKFAAGEIGQIKYRDANYETYASTRALVALAKDKYQLDISDGYQFFTGYKAKQDKRYEVCLKEWINDLVFGIESICKFINPEIIVIGGAIAKQEAIILPLIKENLKQNMSSIYMPEQFEMIDDNEYRIFNGLLKLVE